VLLAGIVSLVFDGFCFTLHTTCGRCCFLFFFLFLIIKQRNNWCVITIFKDFHLKTVNLIVVLIVLVMNSPPPLMGKNLHAVRFHFYFFFFHLDTVFRWFSLIGSC
jgi:hypothetical protein